MTRVIAEQDYTNIAQDLLARAKNHGATAADVMVADGETLSVQVRMGAVDRLTKAREKRLGLRVFFGQRSASASTSDFSRDSLERFVGETCALAQAVVEDPVSGLPEPGQFATDFPELNIHDATKLQTDQQIDLALRTERAAFAADSRITNSEGGECDSSSGRIILANSHGFVGQYANSSFSLSVSPIASDAAGMQRDYWYGVNRAFAKLDSPEAIGQEATRRTVRKLGARKVSTCRVPVIFDPEVAGSLLSHLCSALSGYALYKGASFLIGQLGQQIAPDFVTIYDDGRMPGGLGTRPFDGEGLPTRKQAMVERGRLSQLYPGHLFRQKIRTAFHRKCGAKHRRKSLRRADQFLYGPGHHQTGRYSGVREARSVCDGFDRVRHQHGYRRLFPRGKRVLDRKRRVGLPGGGNYHRR
jgi:PmbA protein